MDFNAAMQYMPQFFGYMMQQAYPQQAYPQQAYPQQAYPQQAYPQQAYPQQMMGQPMPGGNPAWGQGVVWNGQGTAVPNWGQTPYATTIGDTRQPILNYPNVGSALTPRHALHGVVSDLFTQINRNMNPVYSQPLSQTLGINNNPYYNAYNNDPFAGLIRTNYYLPQEYVGNGFSIFG